MTPMLTRLALPALLLASAARAQDSDHLAFAGGDGPGAGKHVVFLAGDEEYRSEEALPMLAQVMAAHGFRCTVLFSIDPDGTVNPDRQSSLSNSAALETADALVMSLRFRNWDDVSMRRFEQAFLRGIPVIGLRTSTHAFNFPKDSAWAKYSFRASAETGWENGFGRQVLGETWVSHHGQHKVEGTRSRIEAVNEAHPILRGVGTIFGTTDVYGANPLADSTILLRGEVTKTLDPESPPVKSKNQPMQPIAWTREYRNSAGTTNRVFCTTMGAATDLADQNLRRLVANGVFWGLGLEVPAKLDVSIPGDYRPTDYGFNTYRRGLRPKDFMVRPAPEFEVRPAPKVLKIEVGDRIVLLGGGLGSRMYHFDHFETELHRRFPGHKLFVRNMCDEGDTPGFRPHPSRNSPWAFPGAERFHGELARGSGSSGHYKTPDEWLTHLRADTIIAFFGFNSSFNGRAGLENFKGELQAFIRHTLTRRYNGDGAPQLVLVSPTAFENLSAKHGTPDGMVANANLSLYTEAMREVAAANGVLFVDLFAPTLGWQALGEEYTIDGALLNDLGYRRLAPMLATAIFGQSQESAEPRFALADLAAAVHEKNWCWLNEYKMPNGVHSSGRRYQPFGPQNYPDEFQKIREMTAIRDEAIWHLLRGERFDVAAADAKTHVLPEVPTNHVPSNGGGAAGYLPGAQSQARITAAEGFKVDLFASEAEFEDLANPVQIAFDNKGRLWVATMPSYPHYRIGDPRPNDKLLILEDTDGDGRADKQTVFADRLHLPIGFELAPEGVYVSQSGSLVLLEDRDGDDRADGVQVLMSGFDDHDTHHAISAFCADPSGAIVMAEGVFLHSNVETAYGPVRGTNGGFFRYAPQQKRLIRYAQFNIPNPWGIAFDDYGQDFFLHTSGPTVTWMMPGTVKPRYGVNLDAPDILTSNKVRPTSGLEFVASRHFPDAMQGDMLLCNAIGFLGVKQHQMIEDGTGFTTAFRQDLFASSDPNFRPVDLEFAPDGSLYVADWHNVLIGHMQHNARDPYRDHVHGRIYRVTYPARPLVTPAKIHGATIQELLDNLRLPEARSRYRTRRELRGRDAAEVLGALGKWVAALDRTDPQYEHHKLEALWVSWGLDQVDRALLRDLLGSKDHRIRAAAVRVLRFNGHRIADQPEALMVAAKDDHGRVRLEAIAAASWLSKDLGLPIVTAAGEKPIDKHIRQAHKVALAHLAEQVVEAEPRPATATALEGEAKDLFVAGEKIYHQPGYCVTCHQADGRGLPDAGFPPLANTEWVLGDEERLVKIILNGLMGPIEVNGRKYPGHAPMTPYGGLLGDREIASVLTFVRNAFGNSASALSADQVKAVRAKTAGKVGFYTPAELLLQHPLK
jgi:mono/diheme cytochrome c family protein/glucose/arabinose dehydrogenase